MKKICLNLIILMISMLSFGQQSSERTNKLNEYPNDWAMVLKNGLYGFIDTNGNEIVKPKYDYIAQFGEYQQNWALVLKDGLYGFIDSNGKVIVKPKYDYISQFSEYQENWALVLKDGLYGFIDNKGKEIIKPKYDSINKGDFIEGIINEKKEEIKTQ